jgi:hypothetical protein
MQLIVGSVARDLSELVMAGRRPMSLGLILINLQLHPDGRP